MQLLLHLNHYIRLMRWHRPIGILLLLWPTLWALWIASKGHPNTLVVIVLLLGTVIMRSAGCVINDIADRNFDDKVLRTKDRPLATRVITVKEALILFLFLSLCAFGLVLLLNRLSIILAFVGITLTIIYPFSKRFTHLPQFILGATFSWGIIIAFAAQTNSVPKIAWYLYVISLLWPVIYDTQYAMVDIDDDKQIGVKSTAILFGQADKFIIGIMQLVMLTSLAILGILSAFNIWYYLGLISAAFLAGYQQYLIKDRQRENCFKAFLNNNWLGFFVFVGLALNYLTNH